MKKGKPLAQIRDEYNEVLELKFWMEDCANEKKGLYTETQRQIRILSEKLKRIDLVREQTRISPFELKKIEIE